jgi:hypothetical protein
MKTYATRPERALDDVASPAPDAERARRNRPNRRARPAPRLDPLAGRSHAGAALPDAIRAPIEARTGVDLGGVRVHNDAYAAAVARGLGTIAAARGVDIYVAGPRVPDAVMAHEAAHAAQARSGAPVGDARTVEAEASRIAAGGGGAPTVRAAPGVFARWEGPEHQDIGGEGTWGRIPLPNYPRGLTYGEIVSLAGDHYGSFQELIHAPAEEIDRILLAMRQQRSAYERGAFEARRAGRTETEAVTAGDEQAYGMSWNFIFNQITNGRFADLGAGAENLTHFSTRDANINRYSRLHATAISMARGGRVQEARAMDAFAAHYLTDRFSAGHLRASADARDVERKRQHDYDNLHGLRVHNLQGDRWILYGDGRLHDPRNARNFALAQQAVRHSRADIDLAAAGGRVPRVNSPTSGERLYRALMLVPTVARGARPFPLLTIREMELQDRDHALLAARRRLHVFPDLWVWATEDDRAVETANGPSLATLPVSQRVVLLQQLLSGATGDEDELAILRILRTSSFEDRERMVDAINVERLYSDIDGLEFDGLLLALLPVYARWSDERCLQHIQRRLNGWTQEWEEEVVLQVLHARGDAGLRYLVDRVGVDTLRDELRDHGHLLEALLRRANRL